MGTGGDQRFNLKRRIAREMFINGYRTKKSYLSGGVNPGEPYKNIRKSLEGIMVLSDENKKIKTATYDQMRVACNPFLRLYATKTMTAFEYYCLFYFIDRLSIGDCTENELFKDISVNGGSEDGYDIKTLRAQLKKHTLVVNEREQSKRSIEASSEKGFINRFFEKGRSFYCIRPEQYPMTSARTGLFDLFPGLIDAVYFFSEVSPVGALGYNIISKSQIQPNDIFVFKHHYIGTALDQIVVLNLFDLMQNNTVASIRTEQQSDHIHLESSKILPLAIRKSVFDGRQFLYGYDITKKIYTSMRIDYIHSVAKYDDKLDSAAIHKSDVELIDRSVMNTIWGYSHCKETHATYHLSISFRYDVFDEMYIYERILREKRYFSIEKDILGSLTICGQVTNTKDLLPWLLSFTGFVEKIRINGDTCDEKGRLKARFIDHITTLLDYYSGKRNYEREQSVSAKCLHKRYLDLIKSKIHTDKELEWQEVMWISSAIEYLEKGTASLSGSYPSPDQIAMWLSKYVKKYQFGNPYKPTPKAILDMWNQREDNSPVFSEYACVKAIRLLQLIQYFSIPRSPQEANEFLRKCRYTGNLRENEFVGDIYHLDYLMSNGFICYNNSENQQSQEKETFVTTLPQLQHLPFTKAEMRWLHTIVEDSRINLFLSADEIDRIKTVLSRYPVIYSDVYFSCVDQYADGDSYDQTPENTCEGKPVYCFRMIRQAIRENKTIKILYRSKKHRDDDPRDYIVYPLKVEYSELDNKFRILAYSKRETGWVRQQHLLSGIIGIEMPEQNVLPPTQCDWSHFTQLVKRPIEVMVADDIETNALERFMIAFSIYKKETVSDSRTGICTVRIWYDPDDEKEVLLKIRSFGKSVLVLDSGFRSAKNNPRARIIGRLERQQKLLSSM